MFTNTCTKKNKMPIYLSVLESTTIFALQKQSDGSIVFALNDKRPW